MNNYQYTGQVEIYLKNVGLVKPNEVVNVDFEINHPLFKKVEKKSKKKS